LFQNVAAVIFERDSMHEAELIITTHVYNTFTTQTHEDILSLFLWFRNSENAYKRGYVNICNRAMTRIVYREIKYF
jgi:hypothetical protein